MKKILLFLSILWLFPYLSCTIQATEAEDAEYLRYQKWCGQMAEEQNLNPVFTLHKDMVIDHGVLGSYEVQEKDIHVTLQTNGYHIYVKGDSRFKRVHITGNQDVVIILKENSTLSLEEGTDIVNPGGTAVQMKFSSSLQEMQFSNAACIRGETAIAFEGAISLSDLWIEGTYAIKGTGTLTASLLYADGLTQAASIHSTMSWFKAVQAAQIERAPLTIATNYNGTPDAEPVYIHILSGMDVETQVLPYLQIELYINDGDTTKSLSTNLQMQNKQLVLKHPAWLQNILDQNHAVYALGFQQPELHTTVAEAFNAYISIEPFGGFYPYMDFPSLYGSTSIELLYSEDAKDWTSKIYYEDLVDSSINSDARISLLAGSNLIKGNTYYFKFKIHGGVYDGYTCQPVKLTISNSMLGIPYDMPCIIPEIENPEHDPGIVEPQLPPVDPSLKDPDPIVGNEGQGGGREESGYQPVTKNDPPEKETGNKVTGTTEKQENKKVSVKKKNTAATATPASNTAKKSIPTSDKTNTGLTSLLVSCSLLLICLIYRKKKRAI